MKRLSIKILVVAVIWVAAVSCSKNGATYENPDDNPNVPASTLAEQLASQMVFVEGGTFTMGQTIVAPTKQHSTREVSDRDDDDSPRTDELPAHEVTVSDFYISKCEITQEQWVAVMGENPSYFEGENLPVESMTWNDIQAFLAKLNMLTGENYRLPTEAEWEYAARGGNKSRGYRYSGSDDVDEVAWYGENSPEMICPVGGKKPNELGLYDMSGNAFEWVFDWYGAYSADAKVNPKGPSSGTYHVLRGGSWKHSSNGCRVSFRTRIPTYHLNKCGFRIVKGISLDNIPYDDEQASDTIEFSSEAWTSDNMTISYRKGIIAVSEAEKPVLVLYLHGGSSKGNDNTAQMKEKAVGIISAYLQNNNISSIMLVPQCPKNGSWGGSMNNILKSLIDNYALTGAIDDKRIYIFGGSMGGTGTWSMFASYPGLFAAAMPVAGNTSAVYATKVAATPIYTVMGPVDTIMSYTAVTEFVKQIKANGGEVKLDIEEGWTHENTCEQSYTDARLAWVFGQTK